MTKKIFSIALAISLGGILNSSAQTPALSIEYGQYQSGHISLTQFYPSQNISVQEANVKLDEGFQYIPNSFYHDIENEKVMFMTSLVNAGNVFNTAQRIVVADAKSGQVIKNTPMNSTMMAVHIPKGNRLGVLSSERGFNGYNNNDDDNSFAIFNMNTGKLLGKVKLNSISVASIRAPFQGKVVTTNGTKDQSEVAISSPVYIPEYDQVAFCALDVTKTYRLYRIDVESMSLISSSALEHFIIDLEYDMKRKKFVALYVDDSENERVVKVGYLGDNGQMEASATVRTIDSREEFIRDGNVELDEQTDEIIVHINKYYEIVNGQEIFHENGLQHAFIYEASDVQGSVKAMSFKTSQVKVDMNYPIDPSRTQVVTLETSVQMYPNPTNSTVQISSDMRSQVMGVKVYNMSNQLVKDFEIRSGGLELSLDVRDLAPGMYMVDIQTAGVGASVYKKLIVH